MSRCHVLVFPAPAQGHITSMLKLAELLSAAAGFHVTFLIPAYIHRRLSRHSDVNSRLRLRSIPDTRQDDIRPGSFDVKEWLESVRETGEPFLREVLGEDEDGVNCVICDGILSFVREVGEERGVPVFYMRTSSASAFWVYFCLPRLIESGQLHFDSVDLDLGIHNIRGVEEILRRRDLPGCCRSGLNSTTMQTIMNQTLQSPQAKGLILNTFHHLESSVLDEIRTQIPNLYAIGPVHTHLRNRVHSVNHSISSSSLWEEDTSCLTWLDDFYQIHS